jgi:hypothetical protein
MDKLVFENPLLKYIACSKNVITKSKKILELHFVKHGYRGYVKRTPRSSKWCLDETVSPQPTSRDRVMHLFRQSGFLTSCLKVLLGAT